MVQCAVFACNSNNNKNLKRNKSENRELLKFFKFPKEKKIEKIWVNKCGRKDKINVKSARICSMHFSRESYVRNLRHELLNYSPKSCKKLESDAIPTENLPFPETHHKEREERQKKREAKKNVQELLANIPPDDEIFPERPNTPEPAPQQVDKSTNTEGEDERLLKTQTELKELLLKNKNLLAENYVLRKEIDTLGQIFTPGQRKKLQRAKRVKWQIEDVSQAIAIYASGPKAYRLLLKKKYPLPAVSTLRSWAGKIDISPGLLIVVFKLMKNADLTPYQKVCVLMADEMKIQRSYEYDEKSDTLLAPTNYVQVIMARGLFENWKQPIFYNYDCNLTVNIFKKIIEKLQEIGYEVVAIVSDLGVGNRSLWKVMEITENNPFFQSPCDPSKNIFIFSDTPHLIKLLRNHFLDDGLRLEDKLLTKEPLEELLALQSNSDLKIASRLTPTHLSVQRGKRQKVKYATQLFSHTNHSALVRMGSIGKATSKYCFELSQLLKEVNDWFDVFNTRVPRIDFRDRMAAYGLELEQQNIILAKMEDTTRKMRVGKHKSLLPFQKGILSNINALKLMFEELKLRYNAKYFLTYRLNQDPLEMFFGVMRAKGGLHDHPTALQFKYRLRSYLLGRNECIISQSANIESDKCEEKKMDLDSSIITNVPIEVDDEEEETCDDKSEEILTGTLLSEFNQDEDTETNWHHTTEEMSDLEYDALEHVAGYIIHRLKSKIPNMLEKYSEIQPTSSFSWTNQLSEGGLQKANENFIQKLKYLEDVFNKINGTKLIPCKHFIQQLLNKSKNNSLEPEIKKLFFRCKMFFKIKIENAKSHWNVDSKKRKINKTIN